MSKHVYAAAGPDCTGGTASDGGCMQAPFESVIEVLRDGAVTIHYQPIIHHGQGEWLGVEALCRPCWRGQPVRPDAWFRAAAACGLAVEADWLALTTAIQTLARSPFSDDVVLFVNVLPSTLMSLDFARRLGGWLESTGWPVERLVLEVVEYVVYDPKQLASAVAAVRDLGVRLALDDFGSPGGSVSALIEWLPDVVKVDRSLVQGIASSPIKQRVFSHFLQFLDHGRWVVAEGVEDREDLAALRTVGVPFSQGYLWSPPSPIQELETLKEAWRVIRAAELKPDFPA